MAGVWGGSAHAGTYRNIQPYFEGKGPHAFFSQGVRSFDCALRAPLRMTGGSVSGPVSRDAVVCVPYNRLTESGWLRPSVMPSQLQIEFFPQLLYNIITYVHILKIHSEVYQIC